MSLPFLTLEFIPSRLCYLFRGLRLSSAGFGPLLFSPAINSFVSPQSIAWGCSIGSLVVGLVSLDATRQPKLWLQNDKAETARVLSADGTLQSGSFELTDWVTVSLVNQIRLADQHLLPYPLIASFDHSAAILSFF